MRMTRVWPVSQPEGKPRGAILQAAFLGGFEIGPQNQRVLAARIIVAAAADLDEAARLV